jgi:hypothetical protein
MKARVARPKATATRVSGEGRVKQGTVTSTKRATATAVRVGGNKESTGNVYAIATATRVAGVKEDNAEGGKGDGNGNGNIEGHGN